MIINSYRSSNSVTVFFNSGSPITINSSNPMYEDVLDALRKRDESFLTSVLDLACRVKHATKGKFLLVEQDGQDVIVLNGCILPKSLSNLLFKMIDVKADTSHLEKFWKNCCKNPEESSRESLYDFIDKNNLTITDDGCFIGYKSVRNDFMDHHTRSMCNDPGTLVRLDRSVCEFDRNKPCSAGLHVAAWKYASTFGGYDSRLIEVKVNPKDVVSVPYDYECQKMRVCEYLVIGEIENERSDIVHPMNFRVEDTEVKQEYNWDDKNDDWDDENDDWDDENDDWDDENDDWDDDGEMNDSQLFNFNVVSEYNDVERRSSDSGISVPRQAILDMNLSEGSWVDLLFDNKNNRLYFVGSNLNKSFNNKNNPYIYVKSLLVQSKGNIVVPKKILNLIGPNSYKFSVLVTNNNIGIIK